MVVPLLTPESGSEGFRDGLLQGVEATGELVVLTCRRRRAGVWKVDTAAS